MVVKNPKKNKKSLKKKAFWTLVGGAGAAASSWIFKELKEKKQLRGAFEKYVEPGLVDEMVKNSDKLSSGEQREVSILFSDLRGFTTLSEGLEPAELFKLLNEYLVEMTQVVNDHDGAVDKYIGDAIMALWNAPKERHDHARKACEAALDMLEALDKLKKKDKVRYGHLNIGVGIHTGHAIIGNVGSDHRYDYTAIGDNVNLTSRLEGLTKAYGVTIIISEETRKQLNGKFATRELDHVRVKGKNKPIPIYELLTSEKKEKHITFEKGLVEYYRGRFDKALSLFKKVRADKASKVFANRCEELIRNPPKKWEGVWTHESK